MARKRDHPRQLDLFRPGGGESTDAAPQPTPAHEPPQPAAPRSDTLRRPPRDVVGPAPSTPQLDALAAAIPPLVRLGTSSWSFPGWAGLVYDRVATETALARGGLSAYARHPLFRTVGIDRTYYATISEHDFTAYAADVPDGFQFLCKAHEALTSPVLSRGGRRSREPSPNFLDPAYAADVVVAPFVRGLGDKAGPLVFQFAPMSRRRVGEPARWLDRLAEFLARLPRGPLYAVEIRNAELLTVQYRDVLSAAGAAHCFTVHRSMPPVEDQAALLAAEGTPAVVVRWMLNHRWDYEGAKTAYEPFDHLVDEDPDSRDAIARLAALGANRGLRVFIIANNKAEGCAPLTLRRLAELMVAREARD